jgi:transposase
MAGDHRRHDISDGTWELLRPHLKGRKGTWGGNARDNRRFINGVLWVLRTGAPWRDLPPDYGDWKNTHRRFCRWRDAGEWERLLEILIQEPDYEWLMIDATHVKVHRDGTGAKGGSQEIGRTKGGSTQRYIWPWIRMVCRSESLLRLATSLTVRRLATLWRA